MRWIARALLVWIVVLALPVQGLAAATLMHCMPAGPAQAPQVQGHHAAHAESASLAEHGAHGDHADHAKAAEAGTTGDPTCSVCAACCLALALPATVARLPALVIEPTFSHEAPPALPSFVPAGLDRPPRGPLA